VLSEVVDFATLQRYTSALREAIGHPEITDVAARAARTFQGAGNPVQKLRAAIPEVDEHASYRDVVEPQMSRAPIQSLLQSALESKFRRHGVNDYSLLKHPPLELPLHPERFGPDDTAWINDVCRTVLESFAQGNHPFNPQPAEYEVSDDARVVIVGDWGSGLPRARAVSSLMAEEVSDALAEGRQAHVIHLGDIYYSGLPEEVVAHALAPGMWPVSSEQAQAGVTSWALNGNHDMYGGGYGFFQTLLGDERFSNQCSSDGRSTSFFRISSPSWDLVGLDTSWTCNVLSEGQVATLEDPQAEFLTCVAGESNRNLMLLSHHPFISAYDTRPEVGQVLHEKLAPLLTAKRVHAWIWGHEHRCMGFQATGGVRFPRCIGNGGVPVLMAYDEQDSVPTPGKWEERGSFEDGGYRWANFGFSVFDFVGPQVNARYRNDHGVTTRSETIT